MNRAATAAALGLTLAAASARAGSVEVVACPFTTAELDEALGRELASLGHDGAIAPATVITCSPSGAARMVIAATPPIEREVELGDVPGALAPRVVAVVLAATLLEADSRPPSAAAPTTAATTAPSMLAPDVVVTRTPTTVPPDLVAPRAGHRRRPALLGDRRWRLGLAARGLTRSYRGNPGPLWGAGVAASLGPFSLGVVRLGATFAHPLGELTTTVTAVDGAVTVLCSRADTTTCLGARLELGTGAIVGTATEPTASGGELTAFEAHGALEVTVAREVGGLELAGALALGGGAGAVARANGDVAARVAGWSVGAALEVRR